MPRHGEITLWIGGVERTFNLAPIKRLEEYESKCGAGIGEIFERLKPSLPGVPDGPRTNTYKAADIYEAMRLGFLGGNPKLSPEHVVEFMANYVFETPLKELQLPAFSIVAAVIVGKPDDNEFLKKKPDPDPATPGTESES